MTKKESGPGYTHTITIETDGDFVGYDARSGYGGVDPEFLLGGAFLALYSHIDMNRTYLEIDHFLEVTQIYLGREDTKEVIKLDQINEEGGTADGLGVFFTLDDIDTIIPIYIGENPPPWA